MTLTSISRTAATAVAGGLLAFSLAGCSGMEENTGSSVLTDAEESAEAASDAVAENVDCSGDSCSVTLDSGAEAEVLNTTISFESVDGDEATLRVGDETVSCSEGEDVTAGPLQLECTTVGDDSVELTATLG